MVPLSCFPFPSALTISALYPVLLYLSAAGVSTSPSRQALSGASAPEPGCGPQRLLRSRSHPAGRCPNNSSLFPPLAAVVAVAPGGRAIGRPGRFLLDEQSFILSGTVVPCGLDSRQLYKARFFRSLCPRKRGPAFCASIRFQRPVQSVPARQCLSLWERCHRR